mmetsp:Transcript_45412/g.126024  ORF Transcript_45412/g.126024 Transcript_45412/m.126024 type:complete len:247 (+) Transcript_45412:497-1237(+)
MLRTAGKALSAISPSPPSGLSIAACQRSFTGIIVSSLVAASFFAVCVKSMRRCSGNVASTLSASVVSLSAAAATESNRSFVGASGIGCQRNMRVLPEENTRKLSTAGGVNTPSCTGCIVMSQSAASAHAKPMAQAPFRKRSRCWFGKRLWESLRTTNRGSSKSTKSSRQPVDCEAAATTSSSAAEIHTHHVFRCGKQRRSDTEAMALSVRQTNVSSGVGGNATPLAFGGERPHAATPKTKVMDAAK